MTILTDRGMHIREVVQIDEEEGTAIVHGYGDDVNRQIEHVVVIYTLRRVTTTTIRHVYHSTIEELRSLVVTRDA